MNDSRTPKHVFHMVWCAFVIPTAIGTGLKVAPRGPNPGKRRPESKNKIITFLVGPSVKFVSPISGLISKRKNGVFFRKKTMPWGGGEFYDK